MLNDWGCGFRFEGTCWNSWSFIDISWRQASFTQRRGEGFKVDQLEREFCAKVVCCTSRTLSDPPCVWDLVGLGQIQAICLRQVISSWSMSMSIISRGVDNEKTGFYVGIAKVSRGAKCAAKQAVNRSCCTSQYKSAGRASRTIRKELRTTYSTSAQNSPKVSTWDLDIQNTQLSPISIILSTNYFIVPSITHQL